MSIGFPQGLVWPLAPNWRERYSVSYEFKTDIFTSRSGKEQRRAQRTTPRKVHKFTVTRTAEQARAFSRFMTLYQGPLVLMADVTRFGRLTEAVGPDDTILHVTSADTAWLGGAQVVMLYGQDSYTAVLIQSVDTAAMTITLAAAVGRAFSVGSKLHPAQSGTFDASLSVKNYQDRTIEAAISFQVDPGTATPDDTGSPSAVFNGREVFTFRPDTLQPIEGSFARVTDIVDFGRGRIQTYLPVSFSTRIKQFQLLAASQCDRADIVGLFQRMKAQRGEFYMSSFEDDFTPVTTAAGGSLNAAFAGNFLDDVYHADDVHRAVLVVAPDGTSFYRRIIASSSDGTNTTLSTDIGWPCDITVATRINWLVVHRFAVDLLTVDNYTDEVAQIQLSVRSLEDQAVASPDAIFAEIDGAGQWVLDNWSISYLNEVGDELDFLTNTEYPYITLSIGIVGVNYASYDLANVIVHYEKLRQR